MNEPGTRRSRLRRTLTGKRLEITTRDVEIFKLLQRYRYLRSTFIHAFVGGRENRFKERLGHLYHEGGYINRPAEQWQCYNARYAPVVYELDKRGEAYLQSLGLEEEHMGRLVVRGRMGANRQFSHALMICETLASIELAVRQDPAARFISWREILSKAPEHTRNAENPFAIPVSVAYTFPRTGKTHTAKFSLVPDGLFGLEYVKADGTKVYRFFALEAERMNRVYCHNLHQTSWLKKVLGYREIAASRVHVSHLGLPNLMVLAVTPTQSRIETMKRLIMDKTEGRGSAMFCFSHIPTFELSPSADPPRLKLFTVPWLRAGYEDFRINRP